MTLYKRVISSERQAMIKRVSNFNKHIKIANACKNPIEKIAHLKKAQKLAKKYSAKLEDNKDVQSS